MEEKKLQIPEGYVFDRVENGEVILKKVGGELPKTWAACLNKPGGGNWRIEGDDIPVRVASDCVKYADALVEELKKEVKHEEDNVQ